MRASSPAHAWTLARSRMSKWASKWASEWTSKRACIWALGWTLLFSSVASYADTSQQSIVEYGKQCKEEVGDIPPFDCATGTNLPITVNGETPSDYPEYMTCDRPSLFSPDQRAPWQCMPYSKVLNLSHDAVQVAVYCRRLAYRKSDDPHYDAVDIVAHNTRSGKTCWFSAKNLDAALAPTAASASGVTWNHRSSEPETPKGIDASNVPPPTKVKTVEDQRSVSAFWISPGETAAKHCVTCHDAGPYIYSPLIGQVWEKMPADPFGKYENIGRDFASWPRTFGIKTLGNTCTGCHRIGNQESCRWYVPFATSCLAPPGAGDAARRYPLDHWMPIDTDSINPHTWDAANVKSVHDLLECCLDRKHKNPKCIYSSITNGPISDKWDHTGQRGAMVPSPQCTSQTPGLVP